MVISGPIAAVSWSFCCCFSREKKVGASRMDISFKDAKILWSGIWYKEVLVNKKRRWLMQMSSQETSEVRPKKLRKPKSLSNKFLNESFVREDEASSHALKINVEKSYTSLCLTDRRLLEVENYMLLSDLHILQSYSLEPSNLKKFHSTLDLLSNNTLGLLANLITKKINTERRRPRIKKVIKDHIPDTLAASNTRELVTTVQLLSEFLIDPRNFHEKQSNFPILDRSSTLTPVFKALESLDSMPIFALSALNRKLRGKKVVPQFPPSKIGYNKKLFVNKIGEQCRGLILGNENSIPKKLSNALSVIDLFLKYKTKCHDTLTSKFLSYSEDKVILQNDILQALWSLPKVTSYQLKYLQSIMGLKAGYNSSSFQNHLKQYLMQCLFGCDEIDIPSVVYDILAILNQSSRSRRTQKCSNEINEGEAEAVLNVSAELKAIFLQLESYASSDDMAAGDLESDDDVEANDFQLVESYYCSNPVKYQQQQIDDELETTGESMPGTYSISAGAPKNIDHSCEMLQKEQDNIHDINHHYMESMKMFPRSSTPATKDFRDISFKESCDETSLVSYRLIGHMLNSFLLVEGLDADARATDHLTGQASASKSFQDQEDMLDASRDNVGIEVLLQSMKDVLPSMSNRCSERVKKLTKKP